MGYQTYFSGEFAVTPQLTGEHAAYLTAFASTRRIARDEVKVAELPDEIREAVGLPVGVDGAYFVGATAPFGQDIDGDSVLDSNSPPGHLLKGFIIPEREVTPEELEAMGTYGFYADPLGPLCAQGNDHRVCGDDGEVSSPHGCAYGISRLPLAPEDRQPGLWCQWVPVDSGNALAWDEGEKFYEYIEWLDYLIRHFLGPWGYKLNGQVGWDGEESGDQGLIVVKDNLIKIATPGPMVFADGTPA